MLRMATAGGHPGRANEDFAGGVPGGMVLVDGAGGVPGAAEVCRHGVAWFARRLGGMLLGGLSQPAGLLASGLGKSAGLLPGGLGKPAGLREVLAEGITAVADMHRDTCEVTHGSSPFGAVAMLRFAEGRAEWLVLGDAVALIDVPGGPPVVVHDPREVVIAGDIERRLDAGVEDRAELLAELRSRRNSPGGFWVVKDDPSVVEEALVGSRPAFRSAALLSNGASSLVDRFHATDWPGLLRLLDTDGPAEVVRRVQELRFPDDATVAYFSGPG
ncbi:hypothetical protein [Actinoplanes rectilineatus]|uniref:hypothetical protein n=1 Tax=Actinoplanes rectilineatus TaxID=113571 RepID=UPI000AD2005F|nr:hypothetical protein [Actinoplanes rectilineatus]